MVAALVAAAPPPYVGPEVVLADMLAMVQLVLQGLARLLLLAQLPPLAVVLAQAVQVLVVPAVAG